MAIIDQNYPVLGPLPHHGKFIIQQHYLGKTQLRIQVKI